MRTILLATDRPETGYEYTHRLLSRWPVDAIFADDTPSVVEKLNVPTAVSFTGRHVGAAQATYQALKWASVRWPGQKILFLEDDVVPLSTPEAVDAVYVGGYGAVCLCDMREIPHGAEAGTYARSPLGIDGLGWWGNQAMLYSPEVLRELVSSNWFQEHPLIDAHIGRHHDDGVQCSDIRVGLAILRLGRTIGVHVPSLFQHLGHDSACFPGLTLTGRETRNPAVAL